MRKRLLVFLSLIAFCISCSNQATFNNSLGTINSEIYGGVFPTNNDYKFVVAITAKKDGTFRTICSGILISEYTVLTAAHCVANNNLRPVTENVKVYFGKGSLGGELEGQFSIQEVHIHPFFMKRSSGYYDFALLTLSDSAIKYNSSKLVFRPYYPEDYENNSDLESFYSPGKKFTIVGFGKTEDGTKGLKKIAHPRVSKNETPEFMLGGDGVDSCIGDSGAPALKKLASGDILIMGISSRGGKCGDGGYYGKPYSVIQWIKRNTTGYVVY